MNQATVGYQTYGSVTETAKPSPVHEAFSGAEAILANLSERLNRLESRLDGVLEPPRPQATQPAKDSAPRPPSCPLVGRIDALAAHLDSAVVHLNTLIERVQL